MYKDDGLDRAGVGALVDAFPQQSLDFFGAVRASAYDDQIRAWIVRDVIDGAISEENAGLARLGARLAQGRDLPEFAPITLTVEGVLEEGRRLAREQELVMQGNLSDSYWKHAKAAGGPGIGLGGNYDASAEGTW